MSYVLKPPYSYIKDEASGLAHLFSGKRSSTKTLNIATTSAQFLSPKVDKGRLTVYRTGESRDFSINPSDIEDNKGFNFERITIPGNSQPMLQVGSGAERIISFTLNLDSLKQSTNKSTGSKDIDYALSAVDQLITGSQYSVVADEISWYRQFVYTGGNSFIGDRETAVDTLMFSYGELYKGLLVVMRKCDVKIIKMSPKLRPMQASIKIELEQYISKSISRSEIYEKSSIGQF
jgi:hypothetical protein